MKRSSLQKEWENHKEREKEREREQTCTQDFACTRSFGMGLTSAEGQKLECFKLTANNIFISTMHI